MTIIVVGLAVSDEATLGVVDMVRHPLTHIMHAIGSLTIGSLIFGIATFRAGVLPRRGAPGGDRADLAIHHYHDRPQRIVTARGCAPG